MVNAKVKTNFFLCYNLTQEGVSLTQRGYTIEKNIDAFVKGAIL